MTGMRFVPDGIHRERGDRKKPPEWYVIWLGPPHGEDSVVIGRSRRLRRHMWHRFFPEAGGPSRDIKGWVAGAEWLMQVHQELSDTP